MDDVLSVSSLELILTYITCLWLENECLWPGLSVKRKAPITQTAYGLDARWSEWAQRELSWTLNPLQSLRHLCTFKHWCSSSDAGVTAVAVRATKHAKVCHSAQSVWPLQCVTQTLQQTAAAVEEVKVPLPRTLTCSWRDLRGETLFVTAVIMQCSKSKNL